MRRFQICRSLKLVVIAYVLYGGAGCQSVAPPSQETVPSTDPVFEAVPGVSRSKDIQDLFGQPRSKPYGERLWEYQWEHPTFLGATHVSAEFTFGAGGVLEKFRYHQRTGAGLPFASGKSVSRKEALAFTPGKAKLHELLARFGQPNIVVRSAGEYIVAYDYVSMDSVLRAAFQLGPDGRVQSILHTDAHMSIDLLGAQFRAGRAPSTEEAMRVTPGVTSYSDLVGRLGDPPHVLVRRDGTQGIYQGSTVSLRDGAQIESWLVATADATGRVTRVVWLNGASSCEPRELAAKTQALVGAERPSREQVLERMGPPAGLVRDEYTEEWVYIETRVAPVAPAKLSILRFRKSGNSTSYFLTFSPAGTVQTVDTQEGHNWLQEASEQYLPARVVGYWY